MPRRGVVVPTSQGSMMQRLDTFQVCSKASLCSWSPGIRSIKTSATCTPFP